jgi:uncharacterized membrane protein YkvA (DUF1232 family)
MASYVGLLITCLVGWFVLRWVWRSCVKPYFRREVRSVRTSLVGAELDEANRLDDNECCICLVEPKVFRVAVTCGHSYCANCIFSIYAKRNHEQIECPLCRAKIITIFKAFPEVEPAEKVEEIRMLIRDYNSKYGDDRSVKRTIVELPFVLAKVVDHIFSFKFLLYFIKTAVFFKMALVAIIYFMLPVDVMPTSYLGVIGVIDNVAVVVAVGLFAVGKAGLAFARQSE